MNYISLERKTAHIFFVWPTIPSRSAAKTNGEHRQSEIAIVNTCMNRLHICAIQFLSNACHDFQLDSRLQLIHLANHQNNISNVHRIQLFLFYTTNYFFYVTVSAYYISCTKMFILSVLFVIIDKILQPKCNLICWDESNLTYAQKCQWKDTTTFRIFGKLNLRICASKKPPPAHKYAENVSTELI